MRRKGRRVVKKRGGGGGRAGWQGNSTHMSFSFSPTKNVRKPLFWKKKILSLAISDTYRIKPCFECKNPPSYKTWLCGNFSRPKGCVFASYKNQIFLDGRKYFIKQLQLKYLSIFPTFHFPKSPHYPTPLSLIPIPPSPPPIFSLVFAFPKTQFRNQGIYFPTKPIRIF